MRDDRQFTFCKNRRLKILAAMLAQKQGPTGGSRSAERSSSTCVLCAFKVLTDREFFRARFAQKYTKRNLDEIFALKKFSYLQCTRKGAGTYKPELENRPKIQFGNSWPDLDGLMLLKKELNQSFGPKNPPKQGDTIRWSFAKASVPQNFATDRQWSLPWRNEKP